MDEQLPDVDVILLHRDLRRAPSFALPEGYAMRPYRAGDLHTWLRIQATDPFFAPTAETFAEALPGDEAYRAERVMFLVGPEGAEIGNITAWNTAEFTGQDIGQVCWVALVPAARGRGLGKPLLSAACAALRGRGYTQAFVDTNMRRVPALNLYLGFGFEPLLRDEEEQAAWRAIAPRLKSAHGRHEGP
ncbi:MAG TPA: GNAT family N-acetyltransferase [Chloroflexaceae bacterium]|nr:GNAT family N-acetyltransferase [Chloroflexaceae bacterium]